MSKYLPGWKSAYQLCHPLLLCSLLWAFYEGFCACGCSLNSKVSCSACSRSLTMKMWDVGASIEMLSSPQSFLPVQKNCFGFCPESGCRRSVKHEACPQRCASSLFVGHKAAKKCGMIRSYPRPKAIKDSALKIFAQGSINRITNQIVALSVYLFLYLLFLKCFQCCSPLYVF
jgi:hypothetical protein